MVIVLASSVIDRGFETHSRPILVKPKKIGICCFSLSTQHYGEKAKSVWLGIGIMCPSGATYLSADSCFSELAL